MRHKIGVFSLETQISGLFLQVTNSYKDIASNCNVSDIHGNGASVDEYKDYW